MNESKHAKWGPEFAALLGESSDPLAFSIPDQQKDKSLFLIFLILHRGCFLRTTGHPGMNPREK